MWLYADIMSLCDIPRFWSKSLPNKPALIDGTGSVSFAALEDRTNRIANGLIARGVAPRTAVGYIGKNSSRFFEIVFGANKAAAALSPLNWRLAAPELTAIVEDSQLSLMFVDAEFVPVAKQVQASSKVKFDIIVFDHKSSDSEFETWLAAQDATEPTREVDPRDTALLIYTSGTTGKPKGVELTHQGLSFMRLCEHLEPALQWKPDDVMLMVMPNFHLVGAGLTLQSLYNGSTLSILPALEAGQLLEIIERDRPSVCALVPTAIQMLLDHPKAKTTDFSSLRLVMYAGSPISSHLLQRALAEMKCRFMQFYGATETSGAATLLRPEQHVIEDEARLRSCGTPLPLLEIKIVDSEGKELPDGEIGEVLIRSPSLFKGYWNQPEVTAAAFAPGGWYKSGDAGRRDAEGLIYLVDRVKDMIVTGGENVYSTEVEQAVVKHPAVRTCAVIGVPDEKWGEKVVAVIIPNPDVAKPTAEDIIAHCRPLIAGYKIPKAVVFVESFPMTATGKILKRAVRDQLATAAKS